MKKVNLKNNKLYFPRGVASRVANGKKVPVEFIEYNDPSCGAYIDARGFLVLPNFNPSSGDQDYRMAILIVDGSIVLKTIAEAIIDTCEYANNPIVSSPTPTPTISVTPTISLTPTNTPTTTSTPTVTPSATPA